MTADRQLRACDVHRLLDGDTSERQCVYCSMCDAWICAEDQGNWYRRIQAALKRKLEPGYKGLEDYTGYIEKLVIEEAVSENTAASPPPQQTAAPRS